MKFIVIGFLSGIAAGFFGIGGGVLIVPMLIYWAGFNQHRATGTSLAVLLPPIGIAAVLEYWRNGNVDIRTAIYIAVAMMIGGVAIVTFGSLLWSEANSSVRPDAILV